MLVKNDVESWYNAIIKLAENPELRMSLAHAAYKVCEEKYTLGYAAQCWEQLFNSLQIKKNKSVAISFADYKKRHKLKQFLLYLFEPSTYGFVMQILKREGLTGLTKRFKRMVLR